MTNEPDRAKFKVEPLNAKHDRTVFSCGVETLDQYLQKQAGQDVKKHAAAVFVLTFDGRTIAGYYTLSQYAIDLGDVPTEIAKKLPKYPLVSATLLGRLAVNVNFSGKGLGESLLMDALYRSLQLSKQIASTCVVVDAKDETARTFYLKYAFLEMPKIEKRLFLPIGTIEQLFQKNRP